MPPRSQTILCLCEAHQISTVPLPHIAYQSLCVPSIARPSLCFATQLQVMPSLHTAVEALAELYAATQRHCYALQHHAVAVQCLSSPLGAMPLPRETMRFHAYPLPLAAKLCVAEHFRRYRRASTPSLCHTIPSIAIALRCHSTLRPCFAVPITAIPGPAIALTRALRR